MMKRFQHIALSNVLASARDRSGKPPETTLGINSANWNERGLVADSPVAPRHAAKKNTSMYFTTSLGLIVAFICLFVIRLEAQSPKGKYGNFALTNATIETITKGSIANGTVLISNGKITAVGTNVTIPEGTEVIDCKGLIRA
jgi:hypothetical protein